MTAYPILPEYDLRPGDKLVSLIPYTTHFPLSLVAIDKEQYDPWPYRCSRDSDGISGLYNASELGITEQELYRIKLRTVYEHLCSMASRSTLRLNGGEHCAYRGTKGKKCAVGVIIPDERYSPGLEGKVVWSGNTVTNALGLPFAPSVRFVWALRRLQNEVHDDEFNWRKNRKGLRSSAKKRAKLIIDEFLGSGVT